MSARVSWFLSWSCTAIPWALACSSAPGSTSDAHSSRLSGRAAAFSAARGQWAHALDGVATPLASPPSTDWSDHYPAFRPDAPHMDLHGGTTLHAPKVVTVTWDGDPNRDLFEAFDDQIGSSSFWRVMSEWGTGPATSGGHVHVPGPFPSITDSVKGGDSPLQQYIRDRALSPSSGWPQNTDQTVYVMWLPGDGPTGDWVLTAIVKPTLPLVDTGGSPLPNGAVEVTIERPVGRNGHIARVTVEPTSRGAGIGAAYLELRSGHVDIPTSHTLPILIGQE